MFPRAWLEPPTHRKC